MKPEQKKKCIKIARYYGLNSQVSKTIEECAELIQAIAKIDEEYTNENLEHISEELADVIIMMEQMRFFFEEFANEIKVPDEFIGQKIERQLARIEKAERGYKK